MLQSPMLPFHVRVVSTAAALMIGACIAPAPTAATTQGTTLELQASLGHRVMKAGERQRVYLRVGVRTPRGPQSGTRMPMNVALVIDRSGSMGGARIAAAREAAMMAVDRLLPTDIVSVVSYDDRIEVEVPATRASDRERIKDRIRRLTARGSTAIWAGMQAGAAEVRKFKSRERVNKIILLSDGLANVGPSRPDDFSRLGRELAGEGITVSTIGLGTGYNEDLMAQLAINADGTHKFVAEPADLAQFFNREFDDAIGIVAREIEIFIDCAPGVRPMRGMGRTAEIQGQRIAYRLNQLVGGSEQNLVMEVEIPADLAIGEQDIASVRLAWRQAEGGGAESQTSIVRGRFSPSATDVDASADADVMRDVTVLTARERKEEAIRLRDAGRLDDARRKFEENVDYMRQQQSRYKLGSSAPVEQELKANEAASAPAAAAPGNWERVRKTLRESDANQAGSKLRY